MGRRIVSRPNAALEEILRADAELEGMPFGGWGGEKVTPSTEPAPEPPSALVISPPPWSVQASADEPVEEDPSQGRYPAKKAKRQLKSGKGASTFDERIGPASATPRLDQVLAWRKESAA